MEVAARTLVPDRRVEILTVPAASSAAASKNAEAK
jgi:hypothetical protein